MVQKWGELVVFSGRRLGFSLGYWELPDIKRAGWTGENGIRPRKGNVAVQRNPDIKCEGWVSGWCRIFQGVTVPVPRAGTDTGGGDCLGWARESKWWWRRHRRSLGDPRGDGERALDMIVPHLQAYQFRQNRYFTQWSMKGLDRFKSILSIAGQEGGDGFWKFLSRGNGFTAAAKGPQAGCFSCLMSDGGGGRHPWPPELGGWVCSPGPAMVQAKGQHWWGKDSTVEEQVSRRQAGRRVCFGRPCCGFLFFVSSWSNSVYMTVNSSPGWSKPELQTDRAHLLEQQSICSKCLQAIGWASLQLCIRFSFVIDWLENHVRPGVSE